MTRRVFLIGPRGAGKSAAGREVAARLGWAFADADAELELRTGKTVAELFAAGEPTFRDAEAETLRALAARTEIVVATGGGVVLRAANRELLRTGFVAWLDAPPAELWARIAADPTTAARRPALTALPGEAEMAAVSATREPLYRAAAAVRIDTSGRTPADVAAAVCGAWAAAETHPET